MSNADAATSIDRPLSRYPSSVLCEWPCTRGVRTPPFLGAASSTAMSAAADQTFSFAVAAGAHAGDPYSLRTPSTSQAAADAPDAASYSSPESSPSSSGGRRKRWQVDDAAFDAYLRRLASAREEESLNEAMLRFTERVEEPPLPLSLLEGASGTSGRGAKSRPASASAVFARRSSTPVPHHSARGMVFQQHPRLFAPVGAGLDGHGGMRALVSGGLGGISGGVKASKSRASSSSSSASKLRGLSAFGGSSGTMLRSSRGGA
eukprot:TRINITY_DN28060_c0_g1_i1.p1 TRINITY_DN28060_c0_g1~~TRINITY_DN28060_c0_g1_i1.p1  ORF type:complete len:262 (-),score=48.63 TRINITY_DN28060_c0_g1_i1:35-820(-)